MSSDDKSRSGDVGESQSLARALPRLTLEQIAQVSPKFVRQTYAAGDVIIHQAEAPDRFYIIIGGEAEVCHENLTGKVEVVDMRKPGEYFGEIGLLTDKPRTATVRASQDGEVEVLALEHQDFKAMIDDSKATETQVARDMVLRLIHLADYQS